MQIKRTNPPHQSAGGTQQADTSKWEGEIDQFVFQLYGLTQEEIDIVEN
jgi:hypothetical protein